MMVRSCHVRYNTQVQFVPVISNPMDFQTMLKKVKQKQYKSKREFKDDLELIWSNCYTYNATEVLGALLSPCSNPLTLHTEPPPPPMRQAPEG